MSFPKRIAITIDENADGPINETLLAWKNVEAADDGKVAVYELVDEFEKTTVPRLRRKGTKNWFLATSATR